MLRKIMDYQLSLVEEGKPLHRLRPLISAADTFLYEPLINTKRGPHIRDAVDLKRWMSMVILALIPCILMAIWNTGVQKLVYTSGDFRLMSDYIAASGSFQGYVDFVTSENRWLTILQYGLMAFIPLMIISYAVGGLFEGLFAVIRGHEIAEGFLVTGMLYPLVLPPTIPYWMAAFGVAAGVVIGKEFFGGTGMNILNPALTCRAFLFFSFPGKMSGDVWVGTNPTVTRESLVKMNAESGMPPVDGFTQATALAKFNIGDEVSRVHVDAIASNTVGDSVGTIGVIKQQLAQWNSANGTDAVLGQLSADQMQTFVTTPLVDGGLGLPPDQYQAAYEFAQIQYGLGLHSDANHFLGNMLGSMGETSTLACIIGALLLVFTGVGSWRVMVAMGLGAFLTASAFEWCSTLLGADGGAWNSARYALPAYKHLLVGGMAFGLVYMATDPVSASGTNLGRWIYGLFIGVIVIVIRAVNPAFPEGVMLAILLGNCFAPLIDYYCVQGYRRRAPRVQTA